MLSVRAPFRPLPAALVACRSEFVTTDAAGGVGVFPLDRLRVSGVGVDVAAEFAS
jgi:hypothetical protein